MSSEQPRRRFDPTPVETSSKSNRQAAQSEENAAPRKFNVQPAETTTRSSKDSNTNGQGGNQSPPRRFNPTPVETSVKSSKDKEQPQSQSARRFAPEPVETSTKSNRQSDPPADKPKSRLLPQPIEMTSNSNRAKSKSPQSKSPATKSPASKSPQTKSPPNEAVSPSSQPQAAPAEKPKRRFAPQLIDTSSRSRKNSDEKPSWSANHRTDISPGEETRVAYNNIGQQITIANRENATSPTEYPRFVMPFARR
ncbi:hypothetical protein KCU77_g19842, partial [Aureobasidium melanogenum]